MKQEVLLYLSKDMKKRIIDESLCFDAIKIQLVDRHQNKIGKVNKSMF